MDMCNKLVELSNTIYLFAAKELSRSGVPATLGRFAVESAYRRIVDDALAIAAMQNNNLESELAKKMHELEKANAKLNLAGNDNKNDETRNAEGGLNE